MGERRRGKGRHAKHEREDGAGDAGVRRESGEEEPRLG